MEENYYKQNITIQVARDSEVFRRIEELAEKTGKPVEEIFSWAVLLGIEKHLEDRLRILERIHEQNNCIRVPKRAPLSREKWMTALFFVLDVKMKLTRRLQKGGTSE